MFRSWAVAGFAPVLGRFFIGEQFLVCGGFQSFAGIIMTRNAGVGANIVPRRHSRRAFRVLMTGCGTCESKRENEQGQQKTQPLHKSKIGAKV
jgi:hypothetical protein